MQGLGYDHLVSPQGLRVSKRSRSKAFVGTKSYCIAIEPLPRTCHCALPSPVAARNSEYPPPSPRSNPPDRATTPDRDTSRCPLSIRSIYLLHPRSTRSIAVSPAPMPPIPRYRIPISAEAMPHRLCSRFAGSVEGCASVAVTPPGPVLVRIG